MLYFVLSQSKKKLYLLNNKIFLKIIGAYVPNLIPCTLKFTKNERIQDDTEFIKQLCTVVNEMQHKNSYFTDCL